MKSKKIIITIVAGILIIFAGIWYFQKPIPASGEPIKIGYIGPLTGDAGVYGETEKNAIDLAVTEVNNNGGINGRPLEIIYEDGKCNGKDAITAAQKLIAVDSVKIILGGVCSSETLAIAPIAESNKVIVFSGFSSNPAITDAGDYIFRNSPSDADVAKLDAETISRSYEKVALLSERTDYSEGVRQIIKQNLVDLGSAVVIDEVYNSTISDFRSVLSKIKASDAEVLYINPGTSAQVGGLIVKQARELGIDVPIHGNFSLGTPDSLAVAEGAVEGIVISDSVGLNTRLGKKLLERYSELFEQAPANDLLMALAYDRVKIISEALSETGEDTDSVRDYLYSINNYSGSAGEYGFDKNGDVVSKDGFFANFIIKDGQKIPF